MIAILLKTLPFFALIGLGFWAGHRRIFPPEAVGWLTKFVFYFALSAMLFRFAANLSLAEIFDLPFVLAYLSASLLLYVTVMALALWRGTPLEEATMEAQCAQSGNTGFLGVPMLVVLLGPAAAGPVLMVLTVDMVVFSSLFTLIITGAARRVARPLDLRRLLALGWLLKNPMIVSIVLGLIWSGAALPLPGPVNEFLAILGGAATPGALFAIGASLAGRGAPRLGNAVWLSFAKLVLHPALVAVSALWLFRIDPQPAGVMIAAASLPVAGNLYILAQHYGVAPQRVSTAILISTAASILTVTAVIAWITG
ncbi:MAG: AEC family transporter [Gemmobacter sp.]|nr:AEC family transporter [Gemmobacter sp.]